MTLSIINIRAILLPFQDNPKTLNPLHHPNSITDANKHTKRYQAQLTEHSFTAKLYIHASISTNHDSSQFTK